MVSTFTPNIQLEEPARGDQAGVWDTPVNNNSTLLDLTVGGIATISLNNSPVVLSAAQFQAKTITFNSTLTGSCAITFPSTFTKSYEIQNLCTGSSAFIITLATTAAGGQVIGVPPGEITECINDGVNIKFKNLGRVGSYWDHAGSSVPAWVDGCSPQKPYLNCDGTTFASSTYPVLAVTLASTTLPDSRGRSRFALNQTTTRISSSISGIDGNTRFAAGGDQSLQTHNHGITDPGHFHVMPFLQNANAGAGGNTISVNTPSVNTGSAVTGITINNSSQGGTAQNMPPAYIGGITMIRSA